MPPSEKSSTFRAESTVTGGKNGKNNSSKGKGKNSKGSSSKGKGKFGNSNSRQNLASKELEEIKTLSERVLVEAPRSGEVFLDALETVQVTKNAKLSKKEKKIMKGKGKGSDPKTKIKGSGSDSESDSDNEKEESDGDNDELMNSDKDDESDSESDNEKDSPETTKSVNTVDSSTVKTITKTIQRMNLTKKNFSDLPISKKTLEGLKSANFNQMTQIQRCSIPHALAGRDVLGEAKTGSGKTLAFLIPVLEKLFRQRWNPQHDGLGAIILSPVKELSHQIFEVLKQIGKFHDFSAGLLLGGRSFESEQKGVLKMNIVVTTPGRLLQHLDDTPGFSAGNLQILVLDEADRILDLGFKDTMNNILQELPKAVNSGPTNSGSDSGRQSLLFSATLRPNIQQLAQVALKPDKQVLSIYGNRPTGTDGSFSNGGNGMNVSTPHKLRQHYCVVPLENKIQYLFSILRAHSTKRIVVFVSSCKQVRYLHETFSRLKPGQSMFELHGKMSLRKRLVTFASFLDKKTHACLITTDVASRGVDIPELDWVIQLDCPDSVDTYLHRVGRTARYENSGDSLLFLLPSEKKGMLERLENKKVVTLEETYKTAMEIMGKSIVKKDENNSDETSSTSNTKVKTTLPASQLPSNLIKEQKLKQSRLINILPQTQSILANLSNVKHLATKAFVSYLKSYHLMPDKTVFCSIDELKQERFALSLGLAMTPEIDMEKLKGRDEKAAAESEKKEKKEKKKEKKSEAKSNSKETNSKDENHNVIQSDNDDIAPEPKTIEELTHNSASKKLKNLSAKDRLKMQMKEAKKLKKQKEKEKRKRRKNRIKELGSDGDFDSEGSDTNTDDDNVNSDDSDALLNRGFNSDEDLNNDDDTPKVSKGKFAKRAEIRKQLRKELEKKAKRGIRTGVNDEDEEDLTDKVMIEKSKRKAWREKQLEKEAKEKKKKKKTNESEDNDSDNDDDDDQSENDADESSDDDDDEAGGASNSMTKSDTGVGSSTVSRLQSEKLKFDKKSGVAKVKGISKSGADSKHMFFDDDDEEENRSKQLSMLEHVTREMKNDESDQESSKENNDNENVPTAQATDDANDVDPEILELRKQSDENLKKDGLTTSGQHGHRDSFLDKVRRRMAKTSDLDKKLAKEKQREKFLKKKERKKQLSNEIKDEIQQAVLGGGSDESMDSTHDDINDDYSDNDDHDENQLNSEYQEEIQDFKNDSDSDVQVEAKSRPAKRVKKMSVEELEAAALEKLLG